MKHLWRAVATCLLVLPIRVNAQRLQITVVAADSASPAVHVPVEVRDSVGRLVIRTGTSAFGKASIPLPSVGTYVVRALRMGFTPAEMMVRVGPGSQAVTLTMSTTPVEISGMRVAANEKCRMSADDGRRFLEVRDQSRIFMESQRVDSKRPLILTGPRFFGRADMDRTRQKIDSSRTSQAILAGPLQPASAEEIATRGYVAYADSNTRAAYDLPNPEIVLSDTFLATHCFSLRRRSADGERQMGLSFTPITFAEAIVDIRGTLWIDSMSAAPRTLEFEYLNLEPTPNHFTTHRDEKGRSYGVIVKAAPPLGVGQIDYAVVGPTLLIPQAWILKTPDLRWLNVVETRISLAQLDGRALFKDAALDSLAVRLFRQFNKKRNNAAFAGFIRDAEGRPISDAAIAVAEFGRLTISDSAGHYAVWSLPAKPVQVRVTSRCFSPLVVRLPLIGDSTRRVDLSLTPSVDSTC